MQRAQTTVNCTACPLLTELRRMLEFFQRSQPQTASIKETVSGLLAEKSSQGLSMCYLRGLRQHLAQLAGEFGERPISSLSMTDLESWLERRREAASTRASNLGRLSALWEYAVRRGLARENIVKKIPPPRIHSKPPRILAPEESRQLLTDCRNQCPEILAVLVVGLFAGVRPLEAIDLRWTQVDTERGLIRVERTKTGRRRIVRLEPACVEWLRICDREQWCPAWSTFRRRRRELREDWPQDVLRHTAASYLLALHQDAGKVAMSLGNSPRILMRHYSELVSPDDCARFWSILPKQ